MIKATLQACIDDYQNTGSYNDEIYTLFTLKTDEYDYLRSHRDHIEKNKLGYGDRAFHYMWYLLVTHIKNNGLPMQALEIGVFKGQVVSLLILIAKNINADIAVTGITPLAGKKMPNKFLSFFLNRFSGKFREDIKSGNFYEETAFLDIIKGLFEDFELDYSKLNLLKGYSTDQAIIDKMQGQKYSMIYIDGDHSYNTVVHDIKIYSPLVNTGGFLVMDDASCNLPGTKFWKGHKSVSDACESIEDHGFKNVLNIGHNRVYQKK
jgi:hypothetical protein